MNSPKKLLIEPPIPSIVVTMDISSNGEMLITGQQANDSDEAYLVLWKLNLESNKDRITKIAGIESVGETTMIFSANFSANDKTLVYAKTGEERVQFYDMEKKSPIKKVLNMEHLSWITLSKNSPRFVIAGLYTEVWNINTFERIWKLPDYKSVDYDAAIAEITPDGSTVAVAGANTDQILLYDIDKNTIIKKINDGPSKALTMHFSNDMRYLAAIGEYGHGVYLWDLEKEKRHLPTLFSSDFDGYWSICFHPDNQHVLFGSMAGYISTYRLNDGEWLSMKDIHDAKVLDLKCTPDGKMVISCAEDGYIAFTDFEDMLSPD